MSWIKKFIFICVGITFPLLIMVIILELLFGSWLHEDKWKSAREINVIRNVEINYDVEKIYGKELTTVYYKRDGNGLRGSCTNPKDVVILTIGGSTTDQRYIPEEFTYQEVLQKLLSKKTNKLICVSNAGIDGHSTFGHLASFQGWFPSIIDLQPKYFLLYVGINDAGFGHNPIWGFDTVKKENDSRFRRAFRENSAIYSLLRYLWDLLYSMSANRKYAGHLLKLNNENEYVATKMTNGVEVHIKHNTEHFEKRFKALLSHVLSLGAKPICVSQPHLFSRDFNGVRKGVENVFVYDGIAYNGLDYDASIKSLNKSMKYLCLEQSGYYIDISTKVFYDNDFYDATHLKPSGGNRLGNYLFDEFINQKIPL